jgi:AcrR family transcriptional regulator
MNVPSGESTQEARVSDPSQEALRARILEAALVAFAERGFHGTAVPDVAKSARVGVGSIYRHFDSKERLVNAVFREAKGRLRDALLLDFDLGRAPREMFAELWARLARFQRSDRLAFQFLEMQDHVPYLDGESRAIEASLLAPLLFAMQRASGKHAEVRADAVMAMVWGAFVGLVKAERLGYLTLDDETMRRAGEACFRFVAATLDAGDHASPRAAKKTTLEARPRARTARKGK